MFLLGVPIMFMLLVTAPILLPEFRDRSVGRADPLSVGMLISTMLAATFGIKQLASHGPTVVPVSALVLGLVLGSVFGRRQRQLAVPLLDLRLFEDRPRRIALIALFLGSAAVGGIYLFITQYLQLVAGHSPLVAGLLLLPAAGGLICASLAAPILARRIRPGVLITVALATSATGFVVLTRVQTADDLSLVVLGFTLVYSGIGPITALGTDLVVGTAPPERAGAASALGETSTELGVAVGVAALGSVGTAVFQTRINERAPVGVSGDTLGEGSETLAAAIRASHDLPAELGDRLAATATSAFTSGLGAAAWLSAATLLAVAVLTGRGLRQVELSDVEAEPADGPAQERVSAP